MDFNRQAINRSAPAAQTERPPRVMVREAGHPRPFLDHDSQGTDQLDNPISKNAKTELWMNTDRQG